MAKKKSGKLRSSKSNRGSHPNEDPERENRIIMEIVVDAYGEMERAMGWYCYLQNKLKFPFEAICTEERQTSPLAIDEEVDVIGMADSDECHSEIFVLIEDDDEDELAVPLSQLQVRRGTADTIQSVQDWHYWVARGYQY